MRLCAFLNVGESSPFSGSSRIKTVRGSCFKALFDMFGLVGNGERATLAVSASWPSEREMHVARVGHSGKDVIG